MDNCTSPVFFLSRLSILRHKSTYLVSNEVTFRSRKFSLVASVAMKNFKVNLNINNLDKEKIVRIRQSHFNNV